MSVNREPFEDLLTRLLPTLSLTLTSVFDQFVPKLSPYMNDSKRTNIATLLKLGELLREMERACSSSEEVIRYVAGFTSQDESMLRLALKVARVDPYLRAEGPPKNQALYEFFYERVPKEQWSSFWAYHAGSGLSNVSMTGLDSSWSRYQQGNKSASPKNDRSRAPHGRGAKGRSSTKIVEPKKPRGSLSVKDSPTLVAPVRSSRRSAVAKKEPDDDSSSLSSLSSSSSGEEELVLLNDTPPEVVPLPVPATWKSSKSSSPRPGAHSPSMGTRSQAVSSDKDALKIVVDGVERAQLVDNDTSGSDDDKEGPATRTSARRAAITRSQVAAPAPSRPKRPSSVPSRDSFQAASQRPKGKGAATKAATKLEEDRLVADEGSKEEDEPPRGTRTRASSRLQSQSQSQSQRQGSGRRGRASKRPSRDAGKGAKEAEATVDDSGEDSRATSPAAEHRQATPKLGTPKPPRTSDGDELAEREFRLPAYEASQESPSFPPDDAAQARRVSLPRDDSQIFQRGNTPQMSDSQAIRALDALDMELENVMSSSAGVESSGVAIADSQDSTESQWKSQRPTDTPLMDKSGVHPMDIDYYADPHSDKGPSSADPVQASDELFTPAMQVVSATQYENMLTVARQGGPRQARVPWTESQRRIEPRSSLKSDSPRRTRRSSNFGNAASTIPLRTARFAEAEKQGYRMGSRHDPKPISLHKDMEDAHVVKKEMRHISTGCLYRLVIVADGHGGPDCARFAVEKLPIRIEAKMNDLDEEELTQENIAKAFLTAITEVDKEYLDILRGRFESWKANGADERRRPSDDGSTLIVNAIFPDFNDPESGDEWLLNVNIGDSRTCVLETAHRARFRFDPVYYSDDQHPGHPAKAHHIVQKTGGSAIIKLSEPASMNLKVPRGLHDLVGSLQDGPRNRHIESLRAGRVLRTEEFLGPESEAVLLGLNIGQHINCGDALGDLLFKLNPPVFQCSPDPGWVRLRADRRYLIVAATDGIWDALKVPTKQPKKQAENLASVIQKQYQEEVNRQLFHSEQPGPSLAPNALQNLLDRVAQQLVDIEKNHLKIFTDHTVYDDATAVLVEIEEAEGFGADYVL